ncbi:hypothetical protein DMENIID0001_071420 [Sergentomyia squamirostris]
MEIYVFAHQPPTSDRATLVPGFWAQLEWGVVFVCAGEISPNVCISRGVCRFLSALYAIKHIRRQQSQVRHQQYIIIFAGFTNNQMRCCEIIVIFEQSYYRQFS